MPDAAMELPAIPYRDGTEPATAPVPHHEGWALVEGVWN